ncbi:hypothetical protein SAMN05216364_100594 [Porphyromonadaceae bacterium KHP3R9]|nr:hypothetical protein SAMN05216364_100594 [Porphyromonadaceae bacterium KHP3R9]
MKNLELLNSIAYTKYSDWKGIISIDNSDLSGVQDLCTNNGISSDKYFIVGFGLGDENSRGISESKSVACIVLLLDKNKYGHSATQIMENTRDEKQINVIRKSFRVPYSDVAKSIKRFSFMALWKTRGEFPEINIIEEE